MSDNTNLTNDHIEKIKNTIRLSFLYVKFKQFLGVESEKSLFIDNDNDNVILNIISHNSLNIFEDQFEQSIIGKISITLPSTNNNHTVILGVHFNDDFKQAFNINDSFITIHLSENKSFYNDVEKIIKEISIIFNNVNKNIYSTLMNVKNINPKKDSKYSVATVKNIAKMFGFE